MRRKIIWAVILLIISHSLFFIGGSTLGKHITLKYFVNETEKTNARLTVGQYRTYRDLAVDINAGRYERAKCIAELVASSMLDEIKACLANQGCRDSVEKNAREIAPETLGEAPLGFVYVESKNGIRRCGDNLPK